ncbi:MAG: FecR family protein [Burkholderiaceae bacterium]|nr:FecR family protein [Burkholderiaceae bacterium]
MQPKFSARWFRVAISLILACVAALAIAADKAGDVSFVIGEAHSIDAAGKKQPIVRGGMVEVGQTLQTGASGHIHLRMIDGAFVSVRPKSKLLIEQYHYDPAVPANNRLKFVLKEGVVRSITGNAGEASRQNYRLNTPLAAIGIRGTDFVVQASNDITRVAVQSGAVVVSPFSDNCLAGALGACKADTARVLTAAMQNAYLELRNRNEAPRLIAAEKALDSPNVIAPPRPEEPKANGNDKSARIGIGTNTKDVVTDVVLGNLGTTIQNGTVPTPAPEPAAKFWWGRWSAFIQPGEESKSFIAQLASGRTPIFGNDVLGLLSETGTVQLPASGSAKFQLANSEAYVLNDHKTLTAAQVSNASLNVDFAARTYETALTVKSSGISPVAVQSSGNITFQGFFQSTAGTAGTTVNGLLSNDTSQAAYVFQRNLSNNLSVVGATRWTR